MGLGAQHTDLCKKRLHTRHDTRRVGATNSLDHLAALEEEEGGHSGDTVVSGNLGELVHVDLVELDAGVLVAQLLDQRGDGLAGTAPGREEVDEDGLLGVGDLLLELVGAVEEKGWFISGGSWM